MKNLQSITSFFFRERGSLDGGLFTFHSVAVFNLLLFNRPLRFTAAQHAGRGFDNDDELSSRTAFSNGYDRIGYLRKNQTSSAALDAQLCRITNGARCGDNCR